MRDFQAFQPRDTRRSRKFFIDKQYQIYRDLLASHAATAGAKMWAWVLTPNHVQLILVPSEPDGRRRCLSSVHRRYADLVHAREKRTSHFWRGRFGCAATDEAHLGAALRHVAFNLVPARPNERTADWP